MPDMSLIMKHLSIMGFKVKDKVTGMEGVATSVSFDLYGCVQVVVNPGLAKDRKPQDSHYYDINRLDRTSKKPVMNPPDFIAGVQAEGKQGAAEKPRLLSH